ncbi:PepSY-associated TM helix domain-containing protein [Acanthopleuribacter pedis]|uniref:PepSY-associated TM helix domain-containing protein n=1 Tax=Acanthopleuribacter pedis TaxID=442870 RepID=A0A8J7U6E8_9BACT|nr:PepSY-associated TM helix domain-containing protein [Acanthopleuribacter pedis]MBO1320286.1 PepSY-associated TM helix domain-containing protein [Acanthopleuribacter pedis]
MIGSTPRSQMQDLGRRAKRKPSAVWDWTKTALWRRIFAWCRWLHVLISTLALTLLLFFCVTGILLNHLDWFESRGHHWREEHSLPAKTALALRAMPDTPPPGLLAFIEARTGLVEPRTISLDRDLGEWTFDYAVPAGYAFATVFIEDGLVEVEFQQGTVIAILNDLHKGRHSGPVWSWVIDLSALIIGFSALTGLVILFQQAKWRVTGLWLVVAGTLLPVLIYVLWVPSVGA